MVEIPRRNKEHCNVLLSIFSNYKNINVIAEMSRRDSEPADQHPQGVVRPGAPGGLQDGDGAGAQAGGETKMHQNPKRSLCQTKSEPSQGIIILII